MSAIQTEWCVITGAPCSGKSTLLAHLSFLGYATRPEAARILIEEELSLGQTLAEIRGHEGSFQERVLDLKLAAEDREDPQARVFFERGIPDSVVYLKICGADTSRARAAVYKYRYRRIFLLEPLPYARDHARTEDAELAQRIHTRLSEAYADLGYPVTSVPVLPLSQRITRIQSCL